MAGLTSGLNAEVVKTSLDEVLYTEFDRVEQPDELSARNPVFFNQDTTGMGSVQYAEYSNVGEFDVHQEDEDRILTSVRTANKTTTAVTNYKKTIPIPVEFFEDDQHSEVNETIRAVGDRGRLTQDKRAVLDIYGDGFDGNTFTTPDGVSLYNNSHTNLNGDTVDNLETGTLTPDNLKTAVRSLRLQVAQDGEMGSHHFNGLLTPTQLYDEALEIMDSDLIANSAENNLNFFQTVYGTVAVKTSGFLDSDFNTATNANTSYYLVGRNHRLSRIVRIPMETQLVSPETDSRDRWMYKARFREVAVPKTWEGTVASNGTV